LEFLEVCFYYNYLFIDSYLGRVSPIFFSTGFALGMASEEGNQLLRQMNERIRQNAIQLEKNRPKPPPFEKLV
jgi:hypothetical protein